MLANKKRIEHAKTTVLRRGELLQELEKDPFMGYKSIEDAMSDCKATSQVEVLARLLNRENLFISGPAGSGKTTIIQKFISIIDAATEGKYNVAITASTGMAASLINGRTIHSWSGLGIFDGNYNPKAKDSPKVFSAWNNLKFVDVLIIDEISMLHAYYINNLDTLLKYVRRNKKPFGGVQIVFLGDFMQLPPVSPREPKEDVNYGYAITAEAWKNADITYCYMDKTHRATDPNLKHMLFKISTDNVDNKTMDIIDTCRRNLRDPNKTYTTLFTTNRNVDNYNAEQLAKVPGVASVFFANTVEGTKEAAEKLIKQRNIIKVLELKIGATIIVTSNITDEDGNIVAANGSVGKVEHIAKDDVIVRLNDGNQVTVKQVPYSLTKKVTIHISEEESFEDEEIEAMVVQLPLKLGYAITVHKSQGQTFDAIEVDLSKCFIPGLGYVALSRVRELKNLVISGMSQRALEVDQISKKLSIFVKKKALMSRKNMEENIDKYTKALSTESIEKLWPESKSGIARMMKAQKQ